MSIAMKKYRNRMRGITLIELMIVVVVLSILAAMAYPAFMDQVRKARRAEAKSTLLETSQALERCYTRFSRYDDGNCGVVLPVNTDEGFYTVSAAALNATSYTLDATPQGDQVQDTQCGTLRLTSAGQQGSQGGLNDPNDCW